MKTKILGLVAVGLLSGPMAASAVVIINNGTLGYYNSGIGTVLNGTAPIFTGDPNLTINTAPSLAPAATVLGGWLNNPPNLTTPGATWSATPVAIPTSWANGTETAVVYQIGSPSTQLTNTVISIGVDNGLLAWLDGNFLLGKTAPGVAVAGEFFVNLGTLLPDVHYLQFLRIGQGGAENWNISVTADQVAVPEPSSLALFGLGLAGLGLSRRRKA